MRIRQAAFLKLNRPACNSCAAKFSVAVELVQQLLQFDMKNTVHQVRDDRKTIDLAQARAGFPPKADYM
jgi:hypothetical protein